jgi:signal recognition particle subunit SRP54
VFESITRGLTNALSKLQTGKLTEGNIRDSLREVRQALLEADVQFQVTNDFIKKITAEAVGEKVLKSLKPSEQIVGIVFRELVMLMGPVDHSLQLKKGLSVIMMCGLQGSGKTTTSGKLAKMLKEEGRKPLLVAADLQRPAAVEQLKIIGSQIGVPVYTEPTDGRSPVKVCQNGFEFAKKNDIDVVILDTAGRLHVDDELMQEVIQIDRKLNPDQVLLVCDSMTGQDAVNSAKAFNEALELDGVILTKLDGDTRGGAALSVKAVTGVPIKYIGVGETLDKLEKFHPERMASRILGGGDLATLAERVQEQFDEEEMRLQQEKLAKGKFTLEDFQKQMKQIKRLGSMGDILKMIPGLGGIADQLGGMNPEKDLGRIDAMISSMTLEERRNPDMIDRSRRTRIARGSGAEPAEINKLLTDFKTMSGVMQKMAGLGVRDRMRAIQDIAGGAMDPNVQIADKKMRSKRGPLDLKKIEEMKKQKRKDAKKQRKKNRK